MASSETDKRDRSQDRSLALSGPEGAGDSAAGTSTGTAGAGPEGAEPTVAGAGPEGAAPAGAGPESATSESAGAAGGDPAGQPTDGAAAAVGTGTRGSQATASRVRGPVDPRLLRRARATRVYLIAGVAVGCATAALTIVQAWVLSRALGDIFATRQLGTLGLALPLLLAVFAGKGLLAWLNQWLAQRAAAAVKSQLRRDVMAARLARPIDPATSSGGLITLVTQGLDALDGYFSKYLPQLVLAVTVPLIIGVAILTADLTSALIVAVTVPLIPFFMALVGWTTEARTKRRWRTQTRLANHFADLVAGLPTLQVFGRAKAQAEGLRRTEAAHRRETMGTLRISFLSALVLELLSTLSVAIVAVSVGFRLVFYGIDLTTAFFVLILAPEVYLPVRQVGVHYHDSADGMAAAEAAFAVIDGGAPVEPSVSDAAPGAASAPAGGISPAPAAPAPSAPDAPPPASAAPSPDRSCPEPSAPRPGPAEPGTLLRVAGLGHTYAGTDAPAVADVSFEAAPGELVVLTGPSGGGKTTVLNALLGFLTPGAGTIATDNGPLTPATARAWRARLAFVGQTPGMVTGTIADNVRLGAPGLPDALVREALDRAGGPDLPLDQRVGDEGEGLSAGERRRVAMARALVRVEHRAAELLLLDEPTAGLDADAEATLLAAVRRSGAAAVVVSHRPAVIAAADRVVTIGGRG